MLNFVTIPLSRPRIYLLCILLSIILLHICLQPSNGQEVTDTNGVYLPLLLKGGVFSDDPPPPPPPPDGPTIGPVTTNVDDYPDGHVPRYGKLELTFAVETEARNLQWPYDPAPPPGIEPGLGITVEALFSPDDWQTVFTQPAFYYQDFKQETKDEREWLYPTVNFAWKVRFAPDQVGEWHYKLVVEDESGLTETSPQTFTVSSSNNKGFVRVSANDPRYFEFDNGALFSGLGYNMNFNQISWDNPVLDNEANFQAMSAHKIQLVRMWLSQWAIFGSSWNPWSTINGPQAIDPPWTFLTPEDGDLYSGHELALVIYYNETPTYPGEPDKGNPCMFLGFGKASPPVEEGQSYRIRVRYRLPDPLPTTPKYPGSEPGFVIKLGDWLWHDTDESQRCYHPNAGQVIAATYDPPSGQSWQTYADATDPAWRILEGTWESTGHNFLPNLYLSLENVSGGWVLIDQVWIEQALGGGQYGPNIVSKPRMDHHLYMEQRNSYAFDQVVSLAETYNIYLRPVIIDRRDWIFTNLDFDGRWAERNDNWFYGNYREMTKGRWLQQTWWRYLQARWGYSPHIHSWELLNEGDPWNDQHYTLADEFGQYMHQFKPNDHLVSTSAWHSFPKDAFWANSEYPHVDFADIHYYIPQSDPNFFDAAQATYDLSLAYGAKQPDGAGKPIIRGETGFTVSGSDPPTDLFEQDTEGIWLHNFIWGGINAGGLIESYWYANYHIYRQNPDGSYQFDHREHFKAYDNFMAGIPLNNGHYQDAQATVSNSALRAWGQKDVVNGCAHLWLQNKNHTWKNIIDGVTIAPISDTVTISGFQPDQSYTVEWWDTYQSVSTQQLIQSGTVIAQADGSISVGVTDLATDRALKIIGSAGCTLPN